MGQFYTNLTCLNQGLIDWEEINLANYNSTDKGGSRSQIVRDEMLAA